MAYRDTPISYRRIELHPELYDKTVIRDVLANGLKQYFNDVEVAWIPCPNLFYPPCKLNALGFFGKSELIIISDSFLSHLNSHQSIENTYDIKKVLRALGRDNKESLVFGNGICQGPSGRLGELVLNTSFSLKNDVLKAHPNNGYITYLDPVSSRCEMELLTKNNLKSIIGGNFYVCDSNPENHVAENPQVLYVYANGPQLQQIPFAGGKQFIHLMQNILHRTFGSYNKYIALGGVYTAEKAQWSHLMIPNDWENQFSIDNRFCSINNSPETIISTFIGSTDTLLSFSQTEPPLLVNACESTHSLIHHSSAQRRCFQLGRFDTTYTGIFRLADFLYYFD